ncbi:MAG: DUF58 domain-containing protein [Lentisphaerae bacterium]|nr:DUF58 domain-containing protein [Lentisphaerota bacterium]
MPETRSALAKYFDAEALARVTAVGYKPLALVEGNLVGDHRSPFHGFAIEFAGHRQYVPGDDVKHLDWKVYFRSGKYLVKQYDQETNFVGHILLDVSETMTFEYEGRRKIDHAAFIAVAIAGAVTSQGDKASATFFSDSIRESIPATGAADIMAKISQHVEHAELKDRTAIGRVLGLMAERIGRRKCVFVISDFYNDPADLFDGVKRLIYNNNEVVLLHVLDPIEMDFDYPGPIELIQLEGEARLLVQGTNIRDSYNKLFGEYLETMRSESHKLGVDYVLCDTSENFGITLSRYLNTRVARHAG